ncbi:MAG TPA: hypothetical protein VFR94_02970 [Nitrososphaeraceae archaeon]|nr:hypothetical protein [Nitrososphaeraceae archaeon]
MMAEGINHTVYLILLLIPILSAVTKHQTGEFIYLGPYFTTFKSRRKLNGEDFRLKKKFRTLTFRLDENVVNQLEDEARIRQISLNALTNQILHRFIEWGRYEQKTKMVPVTMPILNELLRKMTREEIENIAKTVGKNTVEEITLIVKKSLNVESFVSWYLERMKSCSVIVEDNDNETQMYILSHDLGYNWSLLHKTILESVFSQRLNVPLETQISNGTIAFKFRK